MGFLSKLFGKSAPAKLYVDSGMRLTQGLITSFQLPGWRNFLPEYTPEEIKAAQSGLSSFQKTANGVVGTKSSLHPEAALELEKLLRADALREFAGRGFHFADKKEILQDWKARVSTYLKAWISGFSPFCLIDMAEMLIAAGYKTEARQALEVVLLFPIYAHDFYSGSSTGTKLSALAVSRANEILQNL